MALLRTTLKSRSALSLYPFPHCPSSVPARKPRPHQALTTRQNCQNNFEDEVASSPRFHFIGNVSVGHSLPLSSLRPHYHAILFAYGSSRDRELGVPGEDLDGVYSARQFVAWYNGLPGFEALHPKIDQSDQAVIIGQGNVALDVARVLLTPVEKLNNTDMPEYALQTLSRNTIKKVRVIGRRGPMQVR